MTEGPGFSLAVSWVPSGLSSTCNSMSHGSFQREHMAWLFASLRLVGKSLFPVCKGGMVDRSDILSSLHILLARSKQNPAYTQEQIDHNTKAWSSWDHVGILPTTQTKAHGKVSKKNKRKSRKDGLLPKARSLPSSAFSWR